MTPRIQSSIREGKDEQNRWRVPTTGEACNARMAQEHRLRAVPLWKVLAFSGCQAQIPDGQASAWSAAEAVRGTQGPLGEDSTGSPEAYFTD
jgi:hypothetical protein